MSGACRRPWTGTSSSTTTADRTWATAPTVGPGRDVLGRDPEGRGSTDRSCLMCAHRSETGHSSLSRFHLVLTPKEGHMAHASGFIPVPDRRGETAYDLASTVHPFSLRVTARAHDSRRLAPATISRFLLPVRVQTSARAPRASVDRPRREPTCLPCASRRLTVHAHLPRSPRPLLR